MTLEDVRRKRVDLRPCRLGPQVPSRGTVARRVLKQALAVSTSIQSGVG